MKVGTKRSLLSACILGAAMAAPQAMADGRLVVYCSATNAMCEAATKAFSEKYDVKTSFVRNGSGSTLAKIDAEKKNRVQTYGMAVHSILNLKVVRWICYTLTNLLNLNSSWMTSKIQPNARAITLRQFTWVFLALVSIKTAWQKKAWNSTLLERPNQAGIRRWNPNLWPTKLWYCLHRARNLYPTLGWRQSV